MTFCKVLSNCIKCKDFVSIKILFYFHAYRKLLKLPKRIRKRRRYIFDPYNTCLVFLTCCCVVEKYMKCCLHQDKSGKKLELATVIAPYDATSKEQLTLAKGQMIIIK